MANGLYTIFTVGGNDYQLRLGAQQIVNTEKKLGGSILTELMAMGDGNSMLELEKVLIILHGSIQKFNHGVTMEQVYDLYDIYVDEDGSFMDLVSVLIDVLSTSGFFNKAQMEAMNKATPAVQPVKKVSKK